MLQTKTITPEALALLTQLMSDSALDRFILVGGTSIALQLGHRISLDLDLFSNQAFNENDLTEHLRTRYLFELDFLDKETVKGEIEGIKVDCIAHKYPWLSSPEVYGGIRLAAFDDMAAMKLNAVVGNGTRIKDYIDIAWLSTKISLNDMLSAYQAKYRANPVMAMKAITWFDDINRNEPVKMLDKQNFQWKTIRKHLQKMLKYPGTLFDSVA